MLFKLAIFHQNVLKLFLATKLQICLFSVKRRKIYGKITRGNEEKNEFLRKLSLILQTVHGLDAMSQK